MNNFPYGTVLKIQREFSHNDIFLRLKKIKDLGMNTVVIWPAVFWWENKNLPNYPYNTGHEILRYAEEIGLKIIMELSGQITSLEYAPDSIMKEEYYTKTIEGHSKEQEWYFGYLNYNHPEVKMLIRKTFTEAAINYKSYSSLYGYDIWNETMFSSYDAYTLQLFREWLKKKYEFVETLNQVWDRAYYDWSQVEFTKWMWASVMPEVDYNQFKKENIGMLLNEWYSAIKGVDPEHPIIADNIHSMITEDGSYRRPHDDWNAAENVDEYGISFYPKSVPPFKPAHLRCEIFTAVHSATRTGRFWVSEMQSHHQAMFTPISVVYPYELKWWNWEAISRGAKGMIYWMWEPFIKGLQTFGRGLVDHRGSYTQRAFEAQAINKIIYSHNEEFCSYMPVKPKVAILYDKINHDFIKAYTVNYQGFVPGSIYTDSINGLFRCLWEQNIPVKFVTSQDFIGGRVSEYNAVFATSQIHMTNELSNAITNYVHTGGAFISDGRLSMINENGNLYSDIPGTLKSELGWELIDVDMQKMDISLSEAFNNKHLKGYYEKQLLNITDSRTEVLGKFEDGNPAILVSSIGKGQFMHIATYLWYGYFKENDNNTNTFLKMLADRFDISRFKVSNNNVKVTSLEGEGGKILFAFNYSNEKQSTHVELKGVDKGEYSITNLYTNEPKTLESDISGLSIDIELNENDVGIYKLKFLNILKGR
jgi:beta-galactosidase